jgi:hypothetical protein
VWRNTSQEAHTVTDDPSKAVNAADAELPTGWSAVGFGPGESRSDLLAHVRRSRNVRVLLPASRDSRHGGNGCCDVVGLEHGRSSVIGHLPDRAHGPGSTLHWRTGPSARGTACGRCRCRCRAGRRLWSINGLRRPGFLPGWCYGGFGRAAGSSTEPPVKEMQNPRGCLPTPSPTWSPPTPALWAGTWPPTTSAAPFAKLARSGQDILYHNAARFLRLEHAGENAPSGAMESLPRV